jgi:hypothetical protein
MPLCRNQSLADSFCIATQPVIEFASNGLVISMWAMKLINPGITDNNMSHLAHFKQYRSCGVAEESLAIAHKPAGAAGLHENEARPVDPA